MRGVAAAGDSLGGMVARWLLSSIATFAAMFALGALLIGTWAGAAGYAGVIVVACSALWVLRRQERALQLKTAEIGFLGPEVCAGNS